MSWEFTLTQKSVPKLHNPILIEGLPGIGNVGKIAADFIIDNLKATKLYDVFSHDLPNSVFVNEENIVELPTIEIFVKRFKRGKNDILILTGDVQPAEERGSYEFSDRIVDIAKELGVVQIITLGGIGLPEIPPDPRVFCTGNDKTAVDQFANGTHVKTNLYDVVGPIIGVTGILLGLARRKGVPGVCLLAETFGHPAYLGVRGSRALVNILDKKIHLGVKIKALDAEISDLESEGTLEQSGKKSTSLKKVRRIAETAVKKETNYIG
ncbi:PAC2 family protein [Candidatus Woesearchaeota archaeon]|nr:PAC2 family protein [Candidatus Woesearchaeota archaeon]